MHSLISLKRSKIDRFINLLVAMWLLAQNSARLNAIKLTDFYGAPGTIRTCDLCLRSRPEAVFLTPPITADSAIYYCFKYIYLNYGSAALNLS